MVVAWPFPDYRVLLISILVMELLAGWIPYFIARANHARHRNLIGLCGVITAPTIVAYPIAIAWALMARPEEETGHGFEVKLCDE